MSQFISNALSGLVQSDIRRMTRECEKVGGINLGQGICDMPTLDLVSEGARQAIADQKSTYSYPEGIPELREAMARKLKRDNGIEASATSEIVVTAGATGAFVATIAALLNPGDGILIMEPYYGYHLNIAGLAGLKPQFLSLKPPEFELTKERLEAAITEETRAMVVCTPSNPSGKMFSESELQIIADIANDKDLLIISDEIYEYIRYDGRPHISPATVGGLWDRTVSIMGLSKTFSITGWRMGYAVAPAHLAKPITLVNDLYYICAPTPLQHGVAAGFEAPKSYFNSLQTVYQGKRDRICDALTKAGLPPIVPQGAYYVLADVTRLGFDTATDASAAILKRAGVASIPGTSFFQGAAGEHLVRFCFAKEDDALSQACAQLESLRA